MIVEGTIFEDSWLSAAALGLAPPTVLAAGCVLALATRSGQWQFEDN
jgi:hypothetical protein